MQAIQMQLKAGDREVTSVPEILPNGATSQRMTNVQQKTATTSRKSTAGTQKTTTGNQRTAHDNHVFPTSNHDGSTESGQGFTGNTDGTKIRPTGANGAPIEQGSDKSKRSSIEDDSQHLSGHKLRMHKRQQRAPTNVYPGNTPYLQPYYRMTVREKILFHCICTS